MTGHTTPRPSQIAYTGAQDLGESSALDRRSPNDIWKVKNSPTEARWIGAGFVCGGLVTSAALGVQELAHLGHDLPKAVFTTFHLLGPISLVIPAVGGFILGKSRLARFLSILTIGLIASQATWDRLQLPSVNWTLSRVLLAVALTIGGAVVMHRPTSARKDAAV